MDFVSSGREVSVASCSASLPVWAKTCSKCSLCCSRLVVGNIDNEDRMKRGGPSKVTLEFLASKLKSAPVVKILIV
jgi:hypothetical protein